MGAIAFALVQGGENVALFQLAEGAEFVGVRGRSNAAGFLGQAQMLGFEAAAFAAQDDRALDDVLQFADVAWPGMAFEGFHASAGDAQDLHAVFAGEALAELIGQEGNILLVLAQGRDTNGHDVQAEIQILPEFFALDALFEVAVGGGNDPDIHFDGAIAAHAFEFAFLEDAQEFGLDGGGDLADLVE